MIDHDTAERLFDALNRFPHLDMSDRAAIYHAADVQMSAPWANAKVVRLDDPADPLLRPLTLLEACRWVHVPDPQTIIMGLNYASSIIQK